MPIKPPRTDAKGVRITPRDELIFAFLYDMRVATMPQLARLAFEGSEEAAQKRLRMLVNNYYLRQGQEGLLQRIYWLNRKGIEAAVEHPKKGDLKHTEAPSWTKAQHDILAADVRILAGEALAIRTDLTVGTWISEREMRAWKDKPIKFELTSGKTDARQVVFDGFFTVHRTTGEDEEEIFAYGLEIDRGMHSLGVLADSKIAPGIVYIGSDVYKGRFQVDYGRYLFITDGNDDRLAHMVQAASVYKRGNLCYFTNTARLTANSFFTDPIWFVPRHQDPIALITPI